MNLRKTIVNTFESGGTRKTFFPSEITGLGKNNGIGKRENLSVKEVERDIKEQSE
ncbi:hypothetical protein FACS1894123_10730 [Bacteroidia bacterium]|nr:hypothetical protein FACS1894123_10730 [Bacteroidia bacterium]